MKGINTVESQAIALIEDKKINELKRWQVYIKNILVFFRQKNPLLYKFIILKYFNKVYLGIVLYFLLLI